MPSQGPTIAKTAQLGLIARATPSTGIPEYTRQTEEAFPALPFHPRDTQDLIWEIGILVKILLRFLANFLFLFEGTQSLFYELK